MAAAGAPLTRRPRSAPTPVDTFRAMRSPDGHPILAACLDYAMAGLARYRPAVVGAARGRVLEIGVGTGLNLPLYGDVDLVGVEPDPHMLRRAHARLERSGRSAELLPASAEALPFPDASFDTVVATFVFCTIPDAGRAAAEALRVLAPGGVLLFAEHVASPLSAVAGVQRALDPVWQRLGGGCHLTRDPVALLRAAGGHVEVEARGTEWTLAPVRTGRVTVRTGRVTVR